MSSSIPLRFSALVFVLAAAFSLGAVGVTLSGLLGAARSQEAAVVSISPRVDKRPVGPTKFARLEPTNTPLPSRTPTATPTDTPTPLPPPTRTATRKPTAIPSPAATATLSPTPTPAVLRAAIPLAAPCDPVGEDYYAFSLNSPPTDRPASDHPDLNLALRGYQPTQEFRGLINLDGDTAPNAPQLAGLFGDHRHPQISTVYQVFDWDWDSDRRTGLIEDPPVTLIGVAVAPGEPVGVPDAGTNIGLGYDALVLYAASNRITLKYTGEDNVKRGYTLHLENLCVDSNLLALYDRLDAGGRGQLPAVHAGQAIGRAAGPELGIAVRDDGTFMDPRSRKDWWRGQ